MRRILSWLSTLALGVSFIASVASADTVVSVTQVSYDSRLRPQCTTVRMNPATFGNEPSSACTAGASGTFGPDRITQTTYDGAGQVTEIDRGVGSGTGFLNQKYARYTYSLTGQKTSEMDANGNKTMYVYDGFDRLTQIQYPSTTLGSGNIDTADYELFGYDNDGNKTSWQRRNGKTLSYSYDALNREITRSVSDGSVRPVYTAYNLQGKAIYVRYDSASGPGISNSYDGLGRLSSTIDLNGRQVSYGYNQASALISLTYPDGNYLANNLDAENRQTSNYLNGSMLLTAQGYDNLGRRSWLNHGAQGATQTGYGYDNLGRLTSLAQYLNGSNGPGSNVSWSFTYSPASQVASVSPSSTLYDYKEVASSTANNTYDGLNRDAGIAALSGGFDADGNLTSDGTRSFTYDVYNHLLTETAAGANLSLVYDPLGRLSSQTYNGTTTSFLYNGTDLIGEYDASGNMLDRYVHGSGTDEPQVWFQGSQVATPLYFLQDYHGSVIAYTDASGNLQALYKYGPFGEPKSSGNLTNFAGPRFRYTGQTVIPEASLYYYKARVYDPIFGRFLQTDPIGSKADLDLYAYTTNDPINKADPDGKNPITAGAAIGCVADAETGCVPGAVVGAAVGTAIVVGGVCYAIQECHEAVGNVIHGIGHFLGGFIHRNDEDSGAGDEVTPVGTAPDGEPIYPHPGGKGMPDKGEPNSWISGPRGDSHYNPDGDRDRDVDWTHDHGQGRPHTHDWKDGKRGTGRSPTDDERGVSGGQRDPETGQKIPPGQA